MNKEILRLAIPNILSNISTPLLSTVDTVLMGQLSKEYLGAIGIGAMIFNFIYWNFGFLRMGTTGLTAQAYGKRSDSDVIHTLGRALLLGGLLAAFLLVLQKPIATIGIDLMNVSGNQQDLVARYFFVRIWAAPASLALYAFFGWFFGMQNAVIPLLLTIFINVVNIVLSYYLVRVLGWSVEGVALGTVIAQYAGLLLALLLFLWKYRSYFHAFRRKALLQWQELGRFLLINRDIFLRTVFLTLAFGFIYSRSAVSGELILAVNVILLQFLNWMSYGVDGFAFAAESLVGKYAGAQDESGTRKAIRYSFGWGMGLALLFSVCYWVFGATLFGFFTESGEVIETGLHYLWWMILLPIFGSPCYIWDGIYIGLTASKAMRNAMFWSFLIFLISYWLLQGTLGNHGLWLALLVFLTVRGITQWGLYRKYGLEIS
ncbi:MAG: MATE family efflux transporter [Saprospiraceae bacterium]|nr:MATE family efflux transporter [Saprospiraceae bacterium]